MPYQPLHHKYRPQTFAALVGQEAVATTLTHALQQRKIAPAYLFTGARGTGKTSSARILAKSLNCLQSDVPTEAPCGVCEVCCAIANGSALDVIEIDAASNTGVDNIRELIERSQFAPVQCRYKVYVIDECHMLSTAAFNALLKTLEEPPDRVVFVLATTDPQRVLPTIISRCQRFDYRRIALEPMMQHLEMIAQKEAIVIAPEALTLVAQLSQGGLRDAESLLDQLSLLAGEISVERVWDLVGAVPERDLMALVSAIAANDPETLLDTARRLLDRGREPLIVLQNLASFYRDLLIAKTAPQRSDLVALTPPTWAKMTEFVQQLDISAILAGQQHLRSSELQLKNTTQPRLWLEITLLGLLGAIAPAAPSPLPIPIKPSLSVAPPPPVKPIQPEREAIEPVSEPRAIKPVSEPEEPAPDAAPVVPPTPGEQRSGDAWAAMLLQLQPSTQAMLRQQGCLIELTETEAVVGINTRWQDNARTRLGNLEAAFEQSLGRKVQVRLQAITPGELKATREQSSDSVSPSSINPTPTDYNSAPFSKTPHRVSEPKSSFSSEEPPAPPSDPAPQSWETDSTARAAKQLAEFFGGRVVDLSQVEEQSEGTIDAPNLVPLPDVPLPETLIDPDEDDFSGVPF
ncbi:MAG TPA: DNA polymerase III subunit gamma/tau [Thermosynechococcaceae cyanobacterium]